TGGVDLFGERDQVSTSFAEPLAKLQGLPRVPGQPRQAVDHQHTATATHRVYGSLKACPLLHAVARQALIGKVLRTLVPRALPARSDLGALRGEGPAVFRLSAGTDADIGHSLLVVSGGLAGAPGHDGVSLSKVIMRYRVTVMYYTQREGCAPGENA